MLIQALLLGLVLQSGDAAQAGPPASSQITELPTSLIVGRHERLLFERDVRRVFVANPDVLYSEVLDSREILISALQPGSTSLLVWFADGEPLETQLTVRRDLSLLTELVQQIDPAIEVELAPDRDFVILRGVVPSVAIRDAAEAAASAYLGAGWEVPVLAEDEEGDVTAPQGELESRRGRRGGVLNLLRVSDLPAILEERISEAIAPMTEGSVTVRRIQVGNFPDDEKDVFLLEGTVPDQVTLTRLLFVASRTVKGGSGNGSAGRQGDVRVLADEAGALAFGLGGGQGGQGVKAAASGAGSVPGAVHSAARAAAARVAASSCSTGSTPRSAGPRSSRPPRGASSRRSRSRTCPSSRSTSASTRSTGPSSAAGAISSTSRSPASTSRSCSPLRSRPPCRARTPRAWGPATSRGSSAS